MYLLPGIELNNRYKIEEVLGHGGFGITYSALDKILNVKVAIKEYLPRQLATRAEGQTKVSIFTGESRKHYEYGLKKFLEEAQSIAQFSHHPNIVSARDYFETNNTAYMVMEYIEGVTLIEYLEQIGGRIPFEEAKAIMMPVMDALREVHSVGLLHRDISPDNIYITTTGQVKVLDFGAARYYAGEQSKSLSVILKPGYAPEEQYRSSGKQGTWTDVYATGATIYRLVSGKTPPEALDRKEEDTLEPPSQLGISLPVDAEKALLKALAVSAVQRFQTMGEFQNALNNGMPLAEPITTATIIEPFRERPVAPPAKRPKSKTLILISGGVVGIALLGSLLWIMLSPPATKKPIVKPVPKIVEKTTSSMKPPVAIASVPPSPSPAKTDAETRAKDFLEKGRNYNRAKDYERARAALEQAVNLDPKNATAHYELGIAYAKLGNKKMAMEEHKILETKDKELADKLFASLKIARPKSPTHSIIRRTFNRPKNYPEIVPQKAGSIAPPPKQW
jgi:serine/threonine protein kinase